MDANAPEENFTVGSGGPQMKKLDWRYAIPFIIITAVVGGYFLYASFASPKSTPAKKFLAESCTRATNYQNVTSEKNSGITGYNANGQPSQASCQDQSAEAWVTKAYWAVFNRPVDSPALYDELTSQYMQSSGDAPQIIVRELLISNEGERNFLELSSSEQAVALHKNVLERKASKSEIRKWSKLLKKPNKVSTSVTHFLQTQESLKQLHDRVQAGITIAKLNQPNTITTNPASTAAIVNKNAPYVLTGRGSYQTDVAPAFAEKLGNHILIGTFPTTGNQVVSTTDAMKVNAVNLNSGKSEWLSIPTNRSKTEVAGRSGKGGADVSDMCATTVGGNEVAYGISAVPYKNWSVETHGEFPYLPQFTQTNSSAVTYNQSDTLATLEQLQANARSKALADKYLGREGSSGFGECTTLPNGSIAIAQYFPKKGYTSGSIIILSKTGELVAGLRIPTIKDNRGRPVTILPRDLIAAPELINKKAYISMVSDSFNKDGKPVPFPIFELTYSSKSKKLSLAHGPFVSGNGRRFTRSAYLPNGDLVADTLNPTAPGAASVFRSSGTVYYKRSTIDSVKTQNTIQTVPPTKLMIPSPANDEPVGIDIVYSQKHKAILQASSKGSVSAYSSRTFRLCGRLNPKLSDQIPKQDGRAKLGNALKGTYDETNDFWWLPLRITGSNLTNAPLLYGVNVKILTKNC